MNEELLKKAIMEDSEKLYDILDVSYSLIQVDEKEVIKIAKKTNEQLGYTLFNNLSYPQLVEDFSLVTRVLTKKAMSSGD